MKTSQPEQVNEYIINYKSTFCKTFMYWNHSLQVRIFTQKSTVIIIISFSVFPNKEKYMYALTHRLNNQELLHVWRHMRVILKHISAMFLWNWNGRKMKRKTNNCNKFTFFDCHVESKAAIVPKLKDFFHFALAVWRPYLRFSNKAKKFNRSQFYSSLATLE